MINVQVFDFGITSSNEFVRHNEDGSYTICLNARQASNRLRDAYAHALDHIREGDFESDLTADEIESKRHKK